MAKSLKIAEVKNGKLTLCNRAELKKTLEHPDIAHTNVVVISIAGPYRSGKSFILNLFLRFIAAQNEEDLPENKVLNGFKSQGGVGHVTVGIDLWTTPFFVTGNNGQRIAVFLLDTQGVFDGDSIPANDTKIFTFSALISSIQIYNLGKRVGQDQLHYLRMFAEYGRMASEDGDSAPFQHLMFLVRDWQDAEEIPYGSDGGKRYIEGRMKIEPDLHPEVQELRRGLKEAFQNITGFLLPDPKLTHCKSGPKDLTEIDSEFLENADCLFKILCSSVSDLTATVVGPPLTGVDMFELMERYVEALQNIAEPQALYDTLVRCHNTKVVADCVAQYTQKAGQLCRPPMSKEMIETFAIREKMLQSECLVSFDNAKKMGNAEVVEEFKTKLIKEMDKLLGRFAEIKNNQKQIIVQEARRKKDKEEAERQIAAMRAELQADKRLFHETLHAMTEAQKLEREEREKLMQQQLEIMKENHHLTETLVMSVARDLKEWQIERLRLMLLQQQDDEPSICSIS